MAFYRIGLFSLLDTDFNWFSSDWTDLPFGFHLNRILDLHFGFHWIGYILGFHERDTGPETLVFIGLTGFGR